MKEVSEIEYSIIRYSGHNPNTFFVQLCWFKNDLPHRMNDRPAMIRFRDADTFEIISETWLINDIEIRPSGEPVQICYEDGIIRYKRYGVNINFNTFRPCSIEYDEYGKIEQTNWLENYFTEAEKINYNNLVFEWLAERGLDKDTIEIPDEYKAEFKLRFG